MQKANSYIRILYCHNKSGAIDISNDTIIPERGGANDGGSEHGGETLRGGTLSCHGLEVD
jgi:hypothetical protein